MAKTEKQKRLNSKEVTKVKESTTFLDIVKSSIKDADNKPKDK